MRVCYRICVSVTEFACMLLNLSVCYKIRVSVTGFECLLLNMSLVLNVPVIEYMCY